jgi:ribosomal protein L7/L12
MSDAEFARELAQRVQALERRVQRLEAREGLDVPGPARDAGDSFSPPAMAVPEDEIVALLQQNKKVQAIKLYSEATGAGLGDAKAAVDRIETSYLAGG